MARHEWWIHFEPNFAAVHREWFYAAQAFGRRGWEISRVRLRAIGPDGDWFEITSPLRDLVGARPTRMTASAHWLREVGAGTHGEVQWLAKRSGIELQIVESLSGLLWTQHRLAS